MKPSRLSLLLLLVASSAVGCVIGPKPEGLSAKKLEKRLFGDAGDRSLANSRALESRWRMVSSALYDGAMMAEQDARGALVRAPC